MSDWNGSYHLSIEEFALLSSLAGQAEVGKTVLHSAFGPLPEDNERGRLLAASHSLLARGWAAIESGKLSINKHLQAAVAIILDHDFLVQISQQSLQGDGKDVSYFAKGPSVVEQQVRDGVVYRLTALPTITSAAEKARTFFSVPADAAYPLHSQITSDLALIERLQQAVRAGEDVTEVLETADVPPEVASSLAEDFHNQQTRISTMRVEERDGVLVAEHGFLTLQSKDRLWLFVLEAGNSDQVSLLPGTSENIGRELQRLFQ